MPIQLSDLGFEAFWARAEAVHERLASDGDGTPRQWFADQVGIRCDTMSSWPCRLETAPQYAVSMLEALERIAELEQDLQEALLAREEATFTRAARDRVVSEIYADLRRVRPRIQHAVGAFLSGLEEPEEAVRTEAGGIAWDESDLRRDGGAS